MRPVSAPEVSAGSGASRETSSRPAAPDLAEAEELAETFRVLADPGRVRVILALLEAGELSVGDLATVAGLSETACSHALRLLRQGHVVKRRKVGRSVLYSLDDEHVSGLLGLAREHIEHARAGH
jgi:ArsR family transcriptional regulator, lead/cadmium/zinc/bismuth-responsive transcriptional repressor